MRRVLAILAGLGAIACQPALTPVEKAAKDDAEGAFVLAGSCTAQ